MRDTITRRQTISVSGLGWARGKEETDRNAVDSAIKSNKCDITIMKEVRSCKEGTLTTRPEIQAKALHM
jgi:hypothetical protein